MPHLPLLRRFAPVPLLALLTLAACDPPEEEPQPPPAAQCSATVTVNEVIVTRDTDPAPVVDTWTVEAQVLPAFPPNPGAFTTLANGAAGDQGARIVRNAAFGPKVLGPPGRYTLKVLVKATELDPPAENRGTDDTPVFGPQLFEMVNLDCPGASGSQFKFKQTVVDSTSRAEAGEVEYVLQVDMQ